MWPWASMDYPWWSSVGGREVGAAVGVFVFWVEFGTILSFNIPSPGRDCRLILLQCLLQYTNVNCCITMQVLYVFESRNCDLHMLEVQFLWHTSTMYHEHHEQQLRPAAAAAQQLQRLAASNRYFTHVSCGSAPTSSRFEPRVGYSLG